MRSALAKLPSTFLKVKAGELHNIQKTQPSIAQTTLHSGYHCRHELAIKRAADLVISVVMLVLITPILIVVAAAIRLESNGEILFRQKRFGQGNIAFDILKFRTMYADRADITGKIATSNRDPRVTRVGRILRRSSLDELPQLLNVIKGEMSLVGPRPHPVLMQVEGVQYDHVFGNYLDRHRVRPGITGLAQISGSRGKIQTFEAAARRLELDLHYVRNWSLLLDIMIISKTALGGFLTGSD